MNFSSEQLAAEAVIRYANRHTDVELSLSSDAGSTYILSVSPKNLQAHSPNLTEKLGDLQNLLKQLESLLGNITLEPII